MENFVHLGQPHGVTDDLTWKMTKYSRICQGVPKVLRSWVIVPAGNNHLPYSFSPEKN